MVLLSTLNWLPSSLWEPVPADIQLIVILIKQPNNCVCLCLCELHVPVCLNVSNIDHYSVWNFMRQRWKSHFCDLTFGLPLHPGTLHLPSQSPVQAPNTHRYTHINIYVHMPLFTYISHLIQVISGYCCDWWNWLIRWLFEWSLLYQGGAIKN